MTGSADLESRVASWLRSEASASGAERVLEDSLARIAAADQQRRRSWPSVEDLRDGTRRVVGEVIPGIAAAAAILIALAMVATNQPLAPAAPTELPTTATRPPVSSIRPESAMPLPLNGQIVPGRYGVDWASDTEITIAIPDGWWSTTYGSGISVHARGADGPTLTVSGHEIAAIDTRVCGPDRSLTDVGRSGDAVGTVLAATTGVVDLPTELTVAGYPAKRYVLSVPGSCAGPDPGRIWRDIGGGSVVVPPGGTAIIDVVGVPGRAVAFAIVSVGASADELADASAIVASATIVPSERLPGPRRSPGAGISSPSPMVGIPDAGPRAAWSLQRSR
jgi:hypothetical protein